MDSNKSSHLRNTTLGPRGHVSFFVHTGKIPPVLDSENFLLHLWNYFLYNKGPCQMGFVGEQLTITSQSGKGFPRNILGS